jgi:hypothetical protein
VGAVAEGVVVAGVAGAGAETPFSGAAPATVDGGEEALGDETGPAGADRPEADRP